jgi:enoyl-CoA hydratase/carnithine racemase
MMSYNTILYSVEQQILTITLNRPDHLNSFTIEMANELIAAFNRASDDDDVSAIVVTGSGRAFCAGMDLTAVGNVFGLDESINPTLDDIEENLENETYISSVRDTGGRVTLAIFDCKKPVIAAINGAAVGIGATMTCAMDIRLASEFARIGFVFNKIGITPEACSTWFLPRIVGMSNALEWSYTGEILKPDQAQQAGFVKAVYPPDQLLIEAYKIARSIAEKSQVSIALTRQMMYRNSAKDHPMEAHKVDSLAIYYASKTSGKEGVAGFLEKRPAKFIDKASSDMPSFYPWWD